MSNDWRAVAFAGAVTGLTAYYRFEFGCGDDTQAQLAMRKYQELVRPNAPWCPSNIEFIRRINGLSSDDDVKRIVFDAERLPRALASLASLPGAAEALIVSTCNRTEIYCAGAAAAALSDWLVAESGGDRALAECLYRVEGADVARHAFSVASGLFLLALIVWIQRTLQPALQEKD